MITRCWYPQRERYTQEEPEEQVLLVPKRWRDVSVQGDELGDLKTTEEGSGGIFDEPEVQLEG